MAGRNTELKPYCSMPVIIGENVTVTTVCEYLDNFFLSPFNLPDDSILQDLNSYYSSLLPDQMIEAEPQVGLPCVVRYLTDNQFYRSKILKLNDTTAKVLFVDYGNTQVTPLSELKRMTAKYMQLPLLAWGCYLKGVQVKKIASELSIDVKKNIEACFSSKLTAKFYPTDKDGCHPVDLSDSELGDLATYLVQHGIMERSSLESNNNLGTASALVPAISSGLGNFGPVLLPPHEIKQENSLANLKISPAVLHPDEILFVTCCDRFGHFFGQLDRRPVSDLRAMEEELLKVYGSTSETPLLYADEQDHVGHHGVIRWTKDRKWYRVEVVNELFGDEVVVFLVDYGFMTSVPRNDIRAPVGTLKLFTQPPFGIKCRLEPLPRHSNMSSLSSLTWKTTLVGKAVRVHVGQQATADIGYSFQVSLPNCFVNSHIYAALNGVSA